MQRCTDLSIYRSSDLKIHRSIDPAIYRSNDLQIQRSIDPSIYGSGDLQIHGSTDIAIYWSSDLQIHWSTNPAINRSIDLRSCDLQIHRSTGPAIYRSIDLPIQWPTDLAIYRSNDLSIYLPRTSAKTFSQSIFNKYKRWKNLNFLSKIMDYPICKNANFAFFLNCLYCLERLVFKRERHQILFLGVFFIKRNVHKISNFWPKPWTNPFAKMPILWVFETDVFVVQKGLFAI